MIKQNGETGRKGDTLLTLAVGFGVFQFALHVYYQIVAKDPKTIMPTAVAFVHDLFLLSLGYILLAAIQKVVPKKIEGIVAKIVTILFILLGCALAIYPGLLRELLIFPVNIFESDLSASKTVLFEYLGLSSLFPAIMALALGVCLLVTKKALNISRTGKAIGFAVIMIASIVLLRNPSPQPILYSLQSELERFVRNEKRVVPSLDTFRKENSGAITPMQYPERVIAQYDHVLMLVLEGVTAEDFEKEFIPISGGFFEANKDRAAYYANYHTTNLDSYTSLIAMTTGIQVPYRAYADTAYFDRVNQEKNLVDYFNRNQFKTVFVSTYENNPFVPVKTFWSALYGRSDFDSVDQFVSVGSSKMEMATEDRLAIEKMVGEMKDSPKTFIMHELAYGHSPEWRATTGVAQLDYYNRYLTEIAEKLKKEHLFDRTLFVVVSDHGNRANSASVENYHIPLLIVGKGVQPDRNNQFLSHLDLPQIIFYYLGAGTYSERDNKMFIVGSTEKWVYGEITSDNKYLFIDNAKGTIMAKTEQVDPITVSTDFQRYVSEFNLKYGKNSEGD